MAVLILPTTVVAVGTGSLNQLQDNVHGANTQYNELCNVLQNQTAGTRCTFNSNPNTYSIGRIVYSIINVLLGILGLIMVCLVIYAGFLWMTAGGEDKKTEDARKIMTNAVIGLAIIMSAWLLTYFVINNLVKAIDGPTDQTQTVYQ